MKKTFLLLTLCTLMLSCKTSKLVQKDVSIDKFLSNEWISFDIKRLLYDGGTLRFEPVSSKVIIHNASDSTREIAVFDNNYYENSATILNNQRVITIDNSNGFISHQVSNTEPYNDIALNTLQNLMNYFPMYFPHDYGSRLTYSDSTSGYTLTDDNDTIYTIPATIVEKICYSADYCKLVNSPVELGYSSKYKAFVRAKEIKKWYEGNYYNEYEISNICFDNQKNLIDSVFDTKQYNDYVMVPANQFLPTQNTCRNLEATDSVLNYPLINIFSGDTLRLANISGTLLLNYFNPAFSKEYFNKVNVGANGVVDNCIWVLPYRASISKIKSFAQQNDMGTNVYYAEDFQKHYLGGLQRNFLFNNEHKIIGYTQYISGDVSEWVNKMFKKTKNNNDNNK